MNPKLAYKRDTGKDPYVTFKQQYAEIGGFSIWYVDTEHLEVEYPSSDQGTELILISSDYLKWLEERV